MQKTAAVFKEYINYLQSEQAEKKEFSQASLIACLKSMLQIICNIKSWSQPPSVSVLAQICKLLGLPHDPKVVLKQEMLRGLVPRLRQHVSRYERSSMHA